MSSTGYVIFPITTEPEALLASAVARIQQAFPGWEPKDAELDTVMLEAVSAMASDVRDIASQVPIAIFRYFGARLAGLPPIDASAATTTSTWTMADMVGHTIPADTQVTILDSAGVAWAFYVLADVVVPSGSNTTQVGEVILVASTLGVASSGLGAVAAPITLIDTLVFVQSIRQEVITSGGVDAELDSDYLDRLRRKLQLLTPRPILPQDFAILALDIAGIWRATAIDGYNPADNSFNNERMVAVALIDTDGNPVSSVVKNNYKAYIESLREVNFVVNVIDPAYTTINVAFTVTIFPNFDPVDVVQRSIDAVNSYLSPATWGTPPNADARTWMNVTTVAYLEVSTVINNVEGVDRVMTLTVNGGTADVNMTGVATLPRPGTVTGALAP
jgi:hypothetical protein